MSNNTRHIEFHTLPREIQQTLQTLSKDKGNLRVLQNSMYLAPLGVIILGAMASYFLYSLVFEDSGYWPMKSDEIALSAAATFAAFAFFLGAALDIVRKIRGPLPDFWYASEVWLVRCKGHDVTAYPMQDIENLSLTHHYKNGAYTNTTINVIFSDKSTVNILYPNKDNSVMFSAMILQDAENARLHAAAGSLSSLPTASWMSSAKTMSSQKFPRWLRDALISGVLGTVLFLTIGVSIHDDIASENAYESCKNGYSSYSCDDYIELYPTGKRAAEIDDILFNRAKESATQLREFAKKYPNSRHQSETKSTIQSLYTKALENYRSTADSSLSKDAPQGIDVMAAVIQALRDSESTDVYIQYKNTIDFEGKNGHLSAADVKKRYADKILLPVDGAFVPSINEARESSITETLTRTFQSIIPEDLMNFVAVTAEKPLPSTAAVLFEISYTVFPAEYIFVSQKNPDDAMHEINFDWTLRVVLAKQNKTLLELKLTSIPAETIRDMSYNTMADSCFEDFGSHLRKSFGMKAMTNNTDVVVPMVPGAP